MNAGAPMMTVRNAAWMQPGRRALGFSLIELMVVIAIIGLLSAIALPSYRSYVINSNRATAQSEMMTIASKQEQYLLANRGYADKATLGHTIPTGVSSKYTWDVTVGSGTVPTFLITFTPTGTQLSDGAITLDSSGNKLPADKWK